MSRNLAPSRSVMSDSKKATTLDALDTDLFESFTWTDEYKNFICANLPENLLMRFKLGYSQTTTNSSKDSLDLGGNIEYSWNNVNDIFIYGFYNYAKETYPNSSVSNISMDKYGAGGEYSYDFLGEQSGWFVMAATDYKTDTLKCINVMSDNMVGLGYDFKFLQQYGINFDIAIGPGLRYSDIGTYIGYGIDEYISSYDTYYMGYVRQNLTWRISKEFKFEQRFVYGCDLGDLKDFDDEFYEYSIYLSLGLVYSPSDVFSIALRYHYDYDSDMIFANLIKNKNALDSRFMISFEIPIGWKSAK